MNAWVLTHRILAFLDLLICQTAKMTLSLYIYIYITAPSFTGRVSKLVTMFCPK
jgi:hypothetical protein